MDNEHSDNGKKGVKKRVNEQGPSNEFKARMSIKSSVNTQSNFSTEVSEEEEYLTTKQKVFKTLGRVV